MSSISRKISPFRPSDSVRLMAVGDIILGGKLVDLMDKFGPSYPFEHVTSILREADVLVGNLETPLVGSEARLADPNGSLDFRVPDTAADGLKEAGFDLLSLANNHALDFGRQGLQSNLSALDQRGIKYVGTKLGSKEAQTATIIDYGSVRLGFLAYAKSGGGRKEQQGLVFPMHSKQMNKDIRRLNSMVDVVIVFLHMGLMYVDHPLKEDRELVQDLVNNGANLVIGSHPHVLQGVESWSQKFVVYSLGDFVADPLIGNVVSKNAWEERSQSMILDCIIVKEGILELNLHPVVRNEGYQPELAWGQEASNIMARIEDLSMSLNQSDGVKFWRHAGGRVVKHQIRHLLWMLQNHKFRVFWRTLLRLRGKHIKMLWGYLLSFINNKTSLI